MTLISVGFVQAIEIWLRYLITYKININAAGYWTAMNGVSSNYFLFISYAFTLYVLPKFAENNPSFYLFKEVKTILKTLLPIVTIAMIGVYIFRYRLPKFCSRQILLALHRCLNGNWVRIGKSYFSCFCILLSC